MSKSAVLVLALALAVLAVAQGPAPKPDTSKPTPVTGKPKPMIYGLEYWDIVEGTGAVAKKFSDVTVHYTGWVEHGKKFDSSVDHGKPLTFHLGESRVIKGWDQGIVGMKVGGKRQLRIPPELAYGEQGSASIPRNATLIFDIELLAVR
jgi:peptidylprolyl isomerase